MNASFMEIIQTIAAILGALMTWKAMNSAEIDLKVAETQGLVGTTRYRIGRKNLRIERSILAIQVAFFIMGVATIMWVPPPYHLNGVSVADQFYRELAKTAVARQLTMTFASIILLYVSYRNWVDLIPIRNRRYSDPHQAVVIAQRAEIVADEALQLADAAKEAVKDDPKANGLTGSPK